MNPGILFEESAGFNSWVAVLVNISCSPTAMLQHEQWAAANMSLTIERIRVRSFTASTFWVMLTPPGLAEKTYLKWKHNIRLVLPESYPSAFSKKKGRYPYSTLLMLTDKPVCVCDCRVHTFVSAKVCVCVCVCVCVGELSCQAVSFPWGHRCKQCLRSQCCKLWIGPPKNTYIYAWMCVGRLVEDMVACVSVNAKH